MTWVVVPLLAEWPAVLGAPAPLSARSRVHLARSTACPHGMVDHSRLFEPGVTTTVAVKIRLKRFGKIRAPYYRVVIADSRTKRDGRVIEEIGKYHPTEEPSLIEIASERAQYWLGVGAQPSEQVLVLLKITGDWQKFKGLPGAEGTLRVAASKVGVKEAIEAAANAAKVAEAAEAAKAAEVAAAAATAEAETAAETAAAAAATAEAETAAEAARAAEAEAEAAVDEVPSESVAEVVADETPAVEAVVDEVPVVEAVADEVPVVEVVADEVPV